MSGLKFHKEAKLPEVKEAGKRSNILAEKQKIMAELASATSQEEFEERLKLVKAIQDPTVQEESDESNVSVKSISPQWRYV
ncbi:polyprotein [Sesbania bispinosa]|nr:polyprotein [Sesbania bispinosa]